MAISRKDAEAAIERAGGKASESVSRKRELVIAGPGAAFKLDKAQALNMPVPDETERRSRRRSARRWPRALVSCGPCASRAAGWSVKMREQPAARAVRSWVHPVSSSSPELPLPKTGKSRCVKTTSQT